MRKIAFALAISLFAATATAQFTGPGASGREQTVEQIADIRLGSYVIVTGNIVAHQREDYYTLRDATGEIRVEIANSVWRDREISPQTRVRLLGEVDRGLTGRYIWVKSLEVVD